MVTGALCRKIRGGGSMGRVWRLTKAGPRPADLKFALASRLRFLAEVFVLIAASLICVSDHVASQEKSCSSVLECSEKTMSILSEHDRAFEQLRGRLQELETKMNDLPSEIFGRIEFFVNAGKRANPGQDAF